jgi:hypothetical protein
MNREKIGELIMKLYSFYMREVLMIGDFDLTVDYLKTNDYKVLQKFIDKLDKKFGLKSIGIVWLLNYFDRQFQYWLWIEQGGRMKYGLRSIQLAWVIGDKAYKRHDEELRHFYGNTLKIEFRKKLKFTLSEFFPKKENNLAEINEVEEKEKQRYYNTKANFLWCIEETTLFNHKSIFCRVCTNKETCKKVLKRNYTKLYTLRGYE